MEQPKKVWYASYGSNILESRFHCYIAGGKPEGATRTYAGCRDKTLPEDSDQIIITSEVYFAKKAKTWNGGGVAFIKNEFDEKSQTLGRMYLISSEQFEDVVKQEIGLEEDLKIDLKRAEEEGSLIAKENAWYGKIVFLGTHEGHPIFTFTSEVDLDDEINPPNEHYLRAISRGIQEIYDLRDDELVGYFKNIPGVKGREIENKIEALIT